MNEGKLLREAMDSAFGDALDDVMSRAFRANAAHDDTQENETSEYVGRYRLLEQIGEGGFGVVYMAEQQQPIRRRVALKIIKLGMDTKEVVARFEAERQALAMMDHENIASVFDAGATDKGRPYFVMELVRGIPITDYCDRNKLNTHQRLRLFVLVCKAVQHAHQKGIIHRDLKPTNVIVTLREGAPTPKVIDFGVAKATQARLTEKTIFTRHGQFIGTPAYMSPEQVEMSELDVDTRSDIYSLGVMLYELLTGSTPIEQEQLKRASYSEMQRMICQHDPPLPSSKISHSGDAQKLISTQRATEPKRLGQLLRGELDWIVMKTLEKDRTRRYETANGLAADIQRYLNNEPVTASPATATYKLRKFARKHQRWVAVGLAFAALLLASTLISSWLAFKAIKAEAKATHNADLAEQRLDRSQQLGRRLDNQLEHTQRLLYVAHMKTLQRELNAGNHPVVVDLLNRLRPAPGQRDVRGFEWYYAWGISNRDPWTWQHDESVTAVVSSPNGEFIISGCADGSLRVLNVESRRVVSEIGGHEHAIRDMAISRDGKSIATGSNDRTVKTWTFESGKLSSTGRVLQCSGAVRCVALSPDGTHLAAGSETIELGALKLWNLVTDVHHDIEIENEWVYGVTFTPDSAQIASASVNIVSICDVKTAKVTNKIMADLPHLAALAYSPTEHTLAWGGTSGVVELWSEKTGSRRLGKHPGSVNDLAFSTDGRMLASSGSNTAMVWDVKRKAMADLLRGHTAVVSSVVFVPGGTLVSASADRTVKLWDLARGQAMVYLVADDTQVSSVAFSPTDGKSLLSGNVDGSVRLWNIDDAQITEALPPYDGMIRSVAISANGETLAYAGGSSNQPANLFFWDKKLRTVRRTANEHSGAVLAIAFSPDGDTLVSADEDGRLILWDVDAGKPTTELAENGRAIVSVSFSPDGKRIATTSRDENKIAVWNIQDDDRPQQFVGHESGVTTVSFSPDGAYLASGSRDDTVRIWDVAQGKEEFTLAGHVGHVESIAFSPDGQTLASIGQDDTLRLWSVATGQRIANLDCPTATRAGRALAFSPDGRSLAVTNDNSVILYRAPRDKDDVLPRNVYSN